VEVVRLQTLAKQVEAARAEAAAAQGALSRTEAKGHEAVNTMERKLDAAAAEMRDLRTQNEMLLGQLDRAMNSIATDSWCAPLILLPRLLNPCVVPNLIPSVVVGLVVGVAVVNRVQVLPLSLMTRKT